MSDQFTEYRIEVRILRTEQKWCEVPKLCEEYLKAAKKRNGDNMDYWFIYHNIALASKKMGNIDKSLKLSIKALTYVEDDEWHKCEQTYSLWMLAECYKLKGQHEKAIHLYKHISRLYRDVKAYKQRICILYNWVELRKDTRAIERLITIYNSDWFRQYIESETVKSYNEFDECLWEMYDGLIKLYKENGEYEKIFPLISGVNNKSIKQTLMKQITA